MTTGPSDDPVVAYRDQGFLDSDDARPLRIIAEYLDPLARLRRANIGDTIVMFGSARIQSREKALAHLKRVRKDAHGRRSHEWQLKITGAQSLLEIRRHTAWKP